MKNYIFALIIILLAVSCKKEDKEAANTHHLKTIRFTNTPNSFNLLYTIYYNADNTIQRISQQGTTSGGTVNSHYHLYYTASKLDSIVNVDSNGTYLPVTIRAAWTGNNMTSFWNSAYTYDSQNRVTIVNTSSGNALRYIFTTDSIALYFDPNGADPEYLSTILNLNNDVKNPFVIANNESLFPINNYVFNFINNDFKYANTTHAIGTLKYFYSTGTLSNIQYANYSGLVDGYPTQLQISYNNSTETRLLQFTYE